MKNTQVTLIKKTIQRSMLALMLSGAFSATGFIQYTYAKGENAVEQGNEAKADGKFSVAIGNKTQAKGTQAVAMGNESKAEGDFSSSLGAFSEAKGKQATAIGVSSKAKSN